MCRRILWNVSRLLSMSGWHDISGGQRERFLVRVRSRVWRVERLYGLRPWILQAWCWAFRVHPLRCWHLLHRLGRRHVFAVRGRHVLHRLGLRSAESRNLRTLQFR